MQEIDDKRALKTFKHHLDPWRGILVKIDNLLKWKQNFYPAVIISGITAFYALLWIMNLTTITMLSLLGLIVVVLIHFIYPNIKYYCCNTNNWSGNDEAHFESVCAQLFAIKCFFIKGYDCLFTNNEQKSTILLLIISGVLISLAWLGSIFDNLLFMYLLTLTACLYPGIQQQFFSRNTQNIYMKKD